MVQSAANRRRHPRRPLSLALTLHDAASGRSFPARSVDVSAGGLLMYVPLTAPLAVGHEVRLRAADAAGAAGWAGEQELHGRVVRVERAKALAIGHLPVGVAFVGDEGV